MQLEQDNTTALPFSEPEPVELVGLLAEYETVGAVMAAAGKVRKAGFSRWDVHTPFPIHGIDAIMGTRPTILPWLVLGGGVTGLVFGVVLQWFCNAWAYPIIISGKPFWSLPANIPVAFECTVLFSALTAVFGMLVLNKLPMLYNPLFKSERFRRVTDDRFFIVIDASDRRFDESQTTQLLKDAGAVAIEKVLD
jgi:hypothetical protein